MLLLAARVSYMRGEGWGNGEIKAITSSKPSCNYVLPDLTISDPALCPQSIFFSFI
jgi:hypothetical protein